MVKFYIYEAGSGNGTDHISAHLHFTNVVEAGVQLIITPGTEKGERFLYVANTCLYEIPSLSWIPTKKKLCKI